MNIEVSRVTHQAAWSSGNWPGERAAAPQTISDSCGRARSAHFDSSGWVIR
jgi:hypothetical protein